MENITTKYKEKPHKFIYCLLSENLYNPCLMQNALQKAVDIAGGQTRLARFISQTTNIKPPLQQGHVASWLRVTKFGTPPEYCPVIEALTGVPKEELRPDVFLRERIKIPEDISLSQVLPRKKGCQCQQS